MENPKIRFKGFTKDWEQRKFGSLLEETRNKTIFEDEDTLLSCAIDGMYLNSELFSHFRGSSNIGYLKVKKNDLILSAQNLHLGNCNVNLRFEHGIISPAYKVYELVGCNPLFMQAWVKKDSTKDFFLKSSTEGASVCRKNIVWEELYKQELPVPSIEEQTKVGEYFYSLDHLITLHQRKCDQTKNLKKYMLQKMFPQNGAKVPEIRFDGYTYDWEQRKLGELVKEGILEAPLDGNHGEKHPTSDEYVDSGIPFLMASDIHNGEVNIYSCKYITKERAERLDKGFARNGDVLLTHKATIGETAILSNLMTEYAMLTPQVTYYRIKNEERLNREYLYSFFNSLDFQTELKTKAAQSTRPYIGITAQQNLKIILPAEIDEQIRIGLYFRNLDHLITLHQRKCDELKKMKKYMLQNMFI